MAESDKRRVVGVKRMRLGGGRYLQLYVLEGRGPRGGRTVGYIRTRKAPSGSSSAPSGSSAPGSSAPAPRVIIKRKGK